MIEQTLQIVKAKPSDKRQYEQAKSRDSNARLYDTSKKVGREGACNCATLSLCNCATVELWNCGTVELWNCATVQLCNCGTVELWNFVTV